ncbi:MAG: VOC family protein [Arenibacterium sp.]
MNTYIDLPVRNLTLSRWFFEALGFAFNDQFSDETAFSMVIGDTTFAMLPSHDKFRSFTSNRIADTTRSSQVLIALQCDSRASVDAMSAADIAHGGAEEPPPVDQGYMDGHAFSDPDGHIREPFWLDTAADQDPG